MMKKYLIEKVSIGTSKEGETNGRKWKVTNVGIKIGGEWHNTGLFKEQDIDMVKAHEGKELAVELFQEEYNSKMYNKFKVPSKLDLLEQRITVLEKTVFGPVNSVKEDEDVPPLPDGPPPEAESDGMPF